MFSSIAVIVDANQDVRSKAIKSNFTGRNASVLLDLARRSPLASRIYRLRIDRLRQTVPLLQLGLRSDRAICIWERDVTTRLRFNFAFRAHNLVYEASPDLKQKTISELKDDVAFFKNHVVGPRQTTDDFERLARVFVEAVVVKEIAASFYCGGPRSIIQELNAEATAFETGLLPEEMHFLFDGFYAKSRARLGRQVLTALIDEESETMGEFLESMSKPKAFRARFNLGPSAGPLKFQAETLRELAPHYALDQATRAVKDWQHELRNLAHFFPVETGVDSASSDLEAVEATVFEAALGLEAEVNELRDALALTLVSTPELSLS